MAAPYYRLKFSLYSNLRQIIRSE